MRERKKKWCKVKNGCTIYNRESQRKRMKNKNKKITKDIYKEINRGREKRLRRTETATEKETFK